MKNNNSKNKAIKQTTDKKQSTDPIESEYMALVDGVGYPIECSIHLNAESDKRRYCALEIKDIKKTVSYMQPSGAISYKTLTHVIHSADDCFGLACTSNGECELYKIDKDKEIQSSLIAKLRPSKKVVDPSFAFKYDGFLYIAFNIPTQTAIDTGVKGRKPIFFKESNMALMSGAPYIVKVDINNGSIKRISPRFKKMVRYSMMLAHDANGNPMFIVCNILTTKRNQEQNPPTLIGLFKSLFDDTTEKVDTAKQIPFGISIIKIEDECNLRLVNPRGDDSNSIIRIDIVPSSEAGTNSIELLYDQDGKSLVEEIEFVMEILEDISTDSKKSDSELVN